MSLSQTSVVVMRDGSVYTCGYNYYGELGTVTNNSTSTPNNVFTVVPNVANIKYASSGSNHTLLLGTNGTVYSNGYNQFGQLGRTTTGVPHPLSEAVSLPGIATYVACGGSHSAVVLVDGSLYTFGYNIYGQLGTTTNVGTSNINAVPYKVTQITNALKVACGTFHTMVLCSDGSIYAFGYNLNGQLGIATNYNTSTPVTTPTKVADISNVKKIACGMYFTIVLTTEGYVYVAGQNLRGQLGIATNSGVSSGGVSTFTKVTGIPLIKDISCGADFTLLLGTDGYVYAAGNNHYGQLGTSSNLGADAVNATFSKTTLLANVSNIGTGYYHSVAVTDTGKIYTFGSNIYGQLGTPTGSGSSSSFNVPILMTTPSTDAASTIDSFRNSLSIAFTEVNPTRVYSAPTDTCTIKYIPTRLFGSPTVVSGFSASDASNFTSSSYATFDGTLKPVNSYSKSFGAYLDTTNGKVYSAPLDLPNLKYVSSVTILS